MFLFSFVSSLSLSLCPRFFLCQPAASKQTIPIQRDSEPSSRHDSTALTRQALGLLFDAVRAAPKARLTSAEPTGAPVLAILILAFSSHQLSGSHNLALTVLIARVHVQTALLRPSSSLPPHSNLKHHSARATYILRFASHATLLGASEPLTSNTSLPNWRQLLFYIFSESTHLWLPRQTHLDLKLPQQPCLRPHH